MQETPQQYTVRMLSLIGDKDPLKIQQATANKLAATIKGLDKKKLNKRPAPGKWAINEILAHLADAELVGSWRMRIVLNQTALQSMPSIRKTGQGPSTIKNQTPGNRCRHFAPCAKTISPC